MSTSISEKKSRNIIEVFCCSIPEDKRFLDKLKEHLKPFIRRHKDIKWTDIDVEPGMELEKEMYYHLDTAQIILLLMSPAFINSEYFPSVEKRAIERLNCGEARAIPIILSSSFWRETQFSKLKPLPTNEKPIDEVRNKDKAFQDVVVGIRDVVETYLAEEEEHREASEIERVIQEVLPSPSELIFLSAGWVLRKQGYFEINRNQLTEEDVLFYFDGGIPDWQVALSPQIPRREMVSTLYERIEKTYLTSLGVTILLGGGGEGKSTILRQVICDLLLAKNTWNLIWHEDENTSLSIDAFRKLPRDKGAWLIASDNADHIAKDAFNAVKMLREDGRKDIHFLLCCRHIDWKGVGADKYEWASHSNFIENNMPELTLEDARLITEAWSQYGDKGLAKLAGLSSDKAISVLMQRAQSELSKTDGSLLGAMLETRYPGGALDNHVLALITRLDDLDREFGRELRHAYTYIVALHAENQLILTKDLLAHILSCSSREVQERFIGLLEREAATTTRPSGAAAIMSSNKYIFARHRIIAETAVRILSKNFYVDFDDVYERLFRAAIEMFKDGGIRRMPEIRKWRDLPRYFFKNGRRDLALRLAEKVSLELEPHDPLHIIFLSRLYQEDEQFEEGARVFRNNFEKLSVKRKDTLYYHEWATAEGKAENHAISAWLDGIALADGIPPPEREDRYTPVDHIIIALDGMAKDFEHLFQQSKSPTFQNAWGATVQLGLRLEGTRETENARKRLRQSNERCSKKSFPSLVALEYIQEGIIAACKAREVELPGNVKHAKELTFHKLLEAVVK